MKKVIGIISYFPDNQKIKEARLFKLNALIDKCNQLFNLPIIVIAQNWKDINIIKDNLIVYRYEDRLGIVGARKELRKIFLTTNYDYLIMLDDDCSLIGTDGKEYLKQIDEHPNCFGEFKNTLLKLFAISRYILEKQDYLDDYNPELQEGYEDRIFVNILRVKYPENRFIFKNTGLLERSLSTADEYSTWYRDQDLKLMKLKTDKIIQDFKK